MDITQTSLANKEVGFDSLIEGMYELSVQQRVELCKKLLGVTELTVVLGSNFSISNSSSQLSSIPERFGKLIEDLSPNELSELMVIIASRISRYQH